MISRTEGAADRVARVERLLAENPGLSTSEAGRALGYANPYSLTQTLRLQGRQDLALELRNNGRDNRRNADVIEEVEWLLSDGRSTLRELAERLGYRTKEGLRLVLVRGGRVDLLRRISPERKDKR